LLVMAVGFFLCRKRTKNPSNRPFLVLLHYNTTESSFYTPKSAPAPYSELYHHHSPKGTTGHG
jgi:hypothetical protein